MAWVVDFSKTATCCWIASDVEVQEQPELFNCTTCQYQDRIDALWPENGEAWQVFQTLCGRTVSTCELRNEVFGRLTRDWSDLEYFDLLKRLDLILDMVQPRDDASQTDG